MVLSRRDLKVMVFGVLLGGGLAFAYGRLEWNYWRSPGKLYAEMPRLQAWAVRLMALGGPGQNGSADYQVPESEWERRGGTLKDCFADGPDAGVIRYELHSETLSGVYRCTIGDMVGELEVGLNDWGRNGDIVSGYQFRMLDAATAPPIQPQGVFGR
ncbi:MAG: hypothetical protein MUE52_05010 [Tabrizicola sp.]|jgi:hypothetical protein|nr:hypothetical protein [Tabrizicola sp.]